MALNLTRWMHHRELIKPIGTSWFLHFLINATFQYQQDHARLMKHTPLCTEKVQNTHTDRQEHTRLKQTASNSPYCNLADDN